MDINVRSVVLSSLATLLSLLAGIFVYRLREARGFVRNLRKQGLPMPPHSYALGHMLVLKNALSTLPKDAHKGYLFGQLSREYPGALYLDVWPLGEPFLLLTSPELATQAAQTTSIGYDKPESMKVWFRTIAGGPSLFDSNGQQWRLMRSAFNPGFSTGHTLTQVPAMVEHTFEFCEVLREKARKNELCYLDAVTLRFILDLMGKLIMNSRFNMQRGTNQLAEAMLDQVRWKVSNRETNPLEYLNLYRMFVEWRNGRIMDDYIRRELEVRVRAYKEEVQNGKPPQGKSVIDLALQEFFENNPDALTRKDGGLDESFRVFATRNIRMFLFAGHDSTSSTVVYCYHLLATHPDCLARVRAEHDAVLSRDRSAAAALIAASPHLVNELAYTQAVIKEASRLFPAAMAARKGSPGVELVDADGRKYPTENCSILILHQEMQRSAKYWRRGPEFLPERWLVGPEDPLYPMKGAWRTFEYGPRNCIGQGLVFVEIKTILALTVREFDIVPAYDEWDRKFGKPGMKHIEGERVYQIEEGAAHPADKYPCRISIRE